MRRLPAIVCASASVLALAACGSDSAGVAEEDGDGGVTVVTSTNVYASLAEAVAGDAAEVTPIISDPAQDPHEYEATAQDQLTLSEGDLVVMNGGGYDAYMTTMLEALDTDPELIDVVSISGLPGSEEAAESGHDHDHGDEAEAGQDDHEHEHGEDEHEHGEDEHEHGEDGEGEEGHDHGDEGDEHEHGHDHGAFNEHVWYSVPTMVRLVDEVETHLSELSPDDAETFARNADGVRDDLGELTTQIEGIHAEHDGEKAAVTEPVPLWLFEDMGLDNVVPDDFVEAVEAGSDVSPVVLQDSLDALEDDDVKLLGYNSQTSGAEAQNLRDRAEELEIPVVEMTESVPEGESYGDWMGENISNVEQALS